MALSGLAQSKGLSHSDDTLNEVLRILKPNGILVLREPTSTTNVDGLRSSRKLSSALKINGFMSVTEPTEVPLADAEEGVKILQIKCQKPNYEVSVT